MTLVLKHIPLSQIHPNPYQPRLTFKQEELQELAQSIKENGLIQPIIVRPSPIIGYELIAGERRFRACQLAGLEDIPAIVKAISDDESMRQAIIENLQRADLNPIEEAKAYQNLIEKTQLTHDEIAAYMGKSRPYISNSIRLLKLPKEICQGLEEGKISQGHARLLISLKSEQRQLAIYQEIIQKNYSVRTLESKLKNKKTSPTKKDIFIKEQEKKLSQALGLPVHISKQFQNKGQVTISFSNLEDFNRIIDKLS